MDIDTWTLSQIRKFQETARKSSSLLYQMLKLSNVFDNDRQYLLLTLLITYSIATLFLSLAWYFERWSSHSRLSSMLILQPPQFFSISEENSAKTFNLVLTFFFFFFLVNIDCTKAGRTSSKMKLTFTSNFTRAWPHDQQSIRRMEMRRNIDWQSWSKNVGERFRTIRSYSQLKIIPSMECRMNG